MRLVPFPGAAEDAPDRAALAELEAALDGRAEGPEADSWRLLREDVRALAPPMPAELHARLQAELAQRSAAHAPGAHPRPLGGTHTRARSSWQRFAAGIHRHRSAAGAIATACVLLAALLIAAPWQTPSGHLSTVAPRGPGTLAAPGVARATAPAARKGGTAGDLAAVPAVTPSSTAAPTSTSSAAAAPPGAAVSAGSPARLQQLAASMTLATTPADVQSTSDQVAQLAAREGGFVATSNVQVQQGSGEATLSLRLPSSRLGAALASIGRLAPVRSQSQSLQDITDAYASARQRLGDVQAERRALLHALAAATSEGQLQSLHEQLAASRTALAQAESAVAALARHASTAEVEVTVLGDAHAAAEGLTLHHGLHDAGRVLVVSLTVLLIAAAVLVPLALVLAALIAAARLWQRNRRERVLGRG